MVESSAAHPFLLSIAFMICAIGSATPPEFTADISTTVEGKSIPGKIYVTARHYRMELEQEGQHLAIIVDREAGLTRVLLPQNRQFLEMKSKDPTSVANDPFQAIIYIASFAEKSDLGIETINGLECTKYLLRYLDTDMISYWWSQKYDFPIKIVNHGTPRRIVHLIHIVEGPVDGALFEIPDGYTELPLPDKEPVEVPDWAGRVPSAPILTPPFEKPMAAGEMIRVAVVPGKSFWVKATGHGQGDVVARAIPWKNGAPINDVLLFSNFARRGVICDRRHETPVEADEIVIRVFDGTCTVLAKHGDMLERRVTAGNTLGYDIVSGQSVEVRIVNVADGASECRIEFLQDGRPLPDEKVGPAPFRTITLDTPGEAVRRALRPAGDRLAITVHQGEMLIKLGQYDTFQW